MNPELEESRDDPMPRLVSWTQGFADPALERGFRQAVCQDVAPGVQLGLVLAIVLFAAFGVFDVLLGVEALAYTFSIRAGIIVVAVILLATWSAPFHLRHREALLFLFCLLATAALAAIMVRVDTPVMDRYYVGFILIVMAAYLLMGIRFIGGTVIALVNIATYLSVEILFHRAPDIGVLTNLMFLLSVAAIASIGGYSLGHQRRTAYLRHILLERSARASQHNALHDVLTGLPNRRLLIERLSYAVARNARFGRHAAVLFLDLDGFKNINDRYGHATGDRCLQVVAQRLTDCVRETDTVARFGGDEFVVLLEDLATANEVHEALERIEASLAEPVDADGHVLGVSASVGASLHPGEAETPEELLRVADENMYRMKMQRLRAAM